jgi:hypothetical protein
MRRIVFTTGVSLALSVLSGPAQADAPGRYQLRHPGHERCAAAYRRTVVERSGRAHGGRVEIRRVVCVRRQTRLAASIDPAFVQNPVNPLQVTYSYRAAALEDGRATPLPAGTLELSSDGVPRCSAPVAGRIESASCTVTYSAFGPHSVLAELKSVPASASASASESEDIEPFTTSATLTVASAGCHLSYFGPRLEGTSNFCDYKLDVAVTDENGHAPPEGDTTIEIDGFPTAESVSIIASQARPKPEPVFAEPIVIREYVQNFEGDSLCELSLVHEDGLFQIGEPLASMHSASGCGPYPAHVRAVYRDPAGSWLESRSIAVPFG